jgi:hypothetical protein
MCDAWREGIYVQEKSGCTTGATKSNRPLLKAALRNAEGLSGFHPEIFRYRGQGPLLLQSLPCAINGISGWKLFKSGRATVAAFRLGRLVLPGAKTA